MSRGGRDEGTHVECRRRIQTLERKIEQLVARLDHLEAENRQLRGQNRQLEGENRVLRAKLKQNSQNSSKPPSSDPPSAPPRPQNPPSGRKRGGQSGHQGRSRPLLPPDQVDHLVVIKPERCDGCGRRLREEDPNPLRHQVTEMPRVTPEVTEYQRHAVECSCGHVTMGQLPAGVTESWFGPRVEATVAYLSGKAHLSKRQIQDVLSDLFGITISLGAISAVEKRVSRALEEPYREAQRYVEKEPMAHADETGFRQGSDRAWVWVAVTIAVTLFKIHLKRSQKAAKELLGSFSGILITDRWNAYNAWEVQNRQLCWAHLIRDFRGFTEYPGSSAKIGQALLKETERMFFFWYRVRDGTLKFSSFRTYMGPIRRRIETLLERGARCRQPKTAGMCREMLKLAPAMWTFVAIEGVEPTNNMAESQIRPMVLYRKISFGTQSADGSRFVERIMTAVATLQQQGRHVLTYLTQACEAARLGVRAPSLLPRRSSRAAAVA